MIEKYCKGIIPEAGENSDLDLEVEETANGIFVFDREISGCLNQIA